MVEVNGPVEFVQELMARGRLDRRGHWVQMARKVPMVLKVLKAHLRIESVKELVVHVESRQIVPVRKERSVLEHHSLRFVASRKFATRGCTSAHRYNFPEEPHQTRIHNTASSLWDVDSTRTLPGS